MALLRVEMFGVLSLRDEGGPLGGLDFHKVQELLCYLLLYRGRRHQREALAGLLWADTTTAQSRANLRKAIWRLHASLKTVVDPRRPLLESGAESVRIHPLADVWSDVEAFAQTYASVEGRLGEQLTPDEANGLGHAVETYRGSLLEGWYEEWCLCERERFQLMYLAMLDKLMGYCEVSGQFERGLTYGQRALSCEPAHEQIHRRLMRLHFGAGDRTAALRQYERCAVVLRDTFGLPPTDHTTALYHEIRQSSPPPVVGRMLPAAPNPVLSTLVDGLRRVDSSLDQLQLQVREHIRALEELLGPRAPGP